MKGDKVYLFMLSGVIFRKGRYSFYLILDLMGTFWGVLNGKDFEESSLVKNPSSWHYGFIFTGKRPEILRWQTKELTLWSLCTRFTLALMPVLSLHYGPIPMTYRGQGDALPLKLKNLRLSQPTSFLISSLDYCLPLRMTPSLCWETGKS